MLGTMKHLYKEGGIPRFYRGIVPALVQVPCPFTLGSGSCCLCCTALFTCSTWPGSVNPHMGKLLLARCKCNHSQFAAMCKPNLHWGAPESRLQTSSVLHTLYARRAAVTSYLHKAGWLMPKSAAGPSLRRRSCHPSGRCTTLGSHKFAMHAQPQRPSRQRSAGHTRSRKMSSCRSWYRQRMQVHPNSNNLTRRNKQTTSSTATNKKRN